MDACELLAQALVPSPMRAWFDAAVHASGSALPYEELVAADARFARAAARPVIIRESIVERAFGSIKSMFSQHVNTYTGNDPVRTVDAERLWTLAELDAMLQQWIALEWQNKPHPELADPHDAYLPELAPKEMYAACVAVEGYLPIPLAQDDYLRLLPTAWVGVGLQGIRFKNRTYDHSGRDPHKGLNPCRNIPSGLQEKREGPGELRYTPNDPSRVWLRDHHRNEWVEARWVYEQVVGQPFTQFLWDIAASQHLERGGRPDQEERSRRRSPNSWSAPPGDRSWPDRWWYPTGTPPAATGSRGGLRSVCGARAGGLVAAA
ncbi:hypothetical protein ACFZBE_41150 [Streptomyces sp. NPDC008061]|uniref:hypothetical protein n=1 Tax=Streptomyces sp. NPDC008061 TaxID=3364805 RepID=UPI0036E7719D